ncbi:MAG: GNAT family N-acetyltransferase [Actinomycetota bacterium]
MGQTTVQQLGPAWDQLISGRDAEVFSSRPWLACLADAFGLRFEAVTAHVDDQLVGAIPYAAIDDLRGPRITVLPFSDFIVPPVVDGAQWRSLADELMAHQVPITVGAPSDSVVAEDDRFKATSTAVRHVIPLDADYDELVARCATQPRRHLRRAERADLHFRPATSIDELRAFYDIHFGVRKYRHGLLCQPFSLFECVWERFIAPGNGALMLGFDGDTVAGGCLLLSAGDTLYYKYAASHPDYRNHGVSHAAVFAAMELGLERGHRRLDLGRSDVDQPGLVDFKRRFGAEVEPVSRFTWMPDAHHGHDTGAGELLGRLSKLMVSPEVPDAVTEEAGNTLYHLFA